MSVFLAGKIAERASLYNPAVAGKRDDEDVLDTQPGKPEGLVRGLSPLAYATMIEVTPSLSIPDEEISITATRSSGPGGQHVNKVSTRVVLEFDVEASPSLTTSQRQRIRRHLATRIGRDGRLRIRCQRHRSQAANRREVVQRFVALLQEALKPRARRVKTRVPASERTRRLEAKRRRGEQKRRRRRPDDVD
jgi:ribosome-associated protein